MKMFMKLMWVAVAGMFACCGLLAQSNGELILDKQKSDETRRNIERVVNSYVSNNAFEGAILVSKSDQIIFRKAYGFSDREKKKVISSDDSFLLASLSKPITAILVLKLVEQGRLELDDTLDNFIPQFNNKIGEEITLHHLLSHTSGIPNHFEIEGWFNKDFQRNTSDQDYINLISGMPVKFSPGADYHYSNLGYFLLGKVVEKVTKETFSANLSKHIFKPLEMNGSGVAAGIHLAPEIVKGYQWTENGGYREQVGVNVSLFGAAAAVFSNIEDLHRLDVALYGSELLNDKSKKKLFNSKLPYSWRVSKVPISRGREVNVHTYDGRLDGYSSKITRFTDKKYSIILLSNIGVNPFLKDQITSDISSVLFDQKITNRENDASLILINSIVSGVFSETLNKIKLNIGELVLNEQGLSALAYQLLWSGLSHESLDLFSFVKNKFSESSTAKDNFMRACDHPLAEPSELCKS